MLIRSLRPCEEMPAGEPKRLKNGSGYVRLRWRVGPYEYVEVYEHRAVVGNPHGVDVHHKNGIKDDNRLENLEVISRSDHARHHNPTTWDVAEAARLYHEGWSLPRLAERYRKNTGNINRAFKKLGLKLRPSGAWRLIPVDADAVRRMHEAGYRAPVIGQRLGVSVMAVRRVIRELQLIPHRAGRAPGFEQAKL